jgi:hypothetical protein
MAEDLASVRDAVEHAVRVGRLEPHQLAALSKHDEGLTLAQRQEFTEGWRAKGSPAKPAPPRPPLLQVAAPYFAQLDSTTGQGPRMCFSSTCAMAAEALIPGCLTGPGQPDDRYLAIVQKFGDTTEADAQIKALASLGIKAWFRTDGQLESLRAKLREGVPIPVGWLHRGPVTAPTGGGHWSLVKGWDPVSRQVIMNDPNGEAALVSGGYATTAIGSGRGVRYSWHNWGPRWMADGVGSGWWLDLSKPSS